MITVKTAPVMPIANGALAHVRDGTNPCLLCMHICFWTLCLTSSEVQCVSESASKIQDCLHEANDCSCKKVWILVDGLFHKHEKKILSVFSICITIFETTALSIRIIIRILFYIYKWSWAWYRRITPQQRTCNGCIQSEDCTWCTPENTCTENVEGCYMPYHIDNLLPSEPICTWLGCVQCFSQILSWLHSTSEILFYSLLYDIQYVKTSRSSSLPPPPRRLWHRSALVMRRLLMTVAQT